MYFLYRGATTFLEPPNAYIYICRTSQRSTQQSSYIGCCLVNSLTRYQLVNSRTHSCVLSNSTSARLYKLYPCQNNSFKALLLKIPRKFSSYHKLTPYVMNNFRSTKYNIGTILCWNFGSLCCKNEMQFPTFFLSFSWIYCSLCHSELVLRCIR